MDWLVLILVVGYLLLMLGIGIYASKKVKNAEDSSDFLVAGRHLNPMVLAGTLAATAIGGGATLGVVGNTYSKWGASSVWYGIAMGIALLLMSVLAPLIRKTEAKTVPEFFRMRYGRTAGLLHSVISVISMIGITAAQLKASATVIEAMVGMDYNTALLIVAAVITVYSVLGGFWSVALTDGLQLILIFVGMGAAIPFAVHMAGGWSQMISWLPEESLNITAGIGGWPEIFAYIVMFFTAYLVGEEVTSSYYAAENAHTARQGSLTAGAVVIIFAAIPTILGLTMKSLYNMGALNYGVTAALNQDAKYALPALAVSSMPSFVVGILFAGILSATMSSADSALLGAGSVFGNDIYRVFFNKEASPQKSVAVAKVAMIFMMLASFFTAIYGGNILTILVVSFSLRAAGSFIPYLLGHLWKKGSALGCILSILLGTGTYIVLQAGRVIQSPAMSLYPSLAAGAAAYVAASVFVKKPHRE